ncbi:MAG TPA: NYN domain-containing protein [Vicinamibacterales bacterium]
MAEPRLKIAVFIDFDNIEIGVKTTLGTHFDAGAVLEAIKERGEVVTKIAYGDWTRAGDYSRSLTQHAIHMVQRNLTPGGDKNGADINLALDALEMAFTHSHINTFVIVGGDSDFMALVEKLKQYDRRVVVVGGRAFTSHILQKNCHEFIAYENLIGRRGGARGRAQQDTPLTGAVSLVRRALKVLADREVSPQLGVLKSTLLQLDPTFSEREYGASTFRDLVQRLARAGYVTLKGTDRNIYVELREGTDGAPVLQGGRDGEAGGESGAAIAEGEAADTSAGVAEADAAAAEPAAREGRRSEGERANGGREHAARESDGREPQPAVPTAEQQAAGYALIHEVFQRPGVVTRWPLYLRQVKQILRAADETFDERRYGFGGIVEALRYAQREGLFRLDRDRQGVLRVYPGALLQRAAPRPEGLPADEGDGTQESLPELAPQSAPPSETVNAVNAAEPAALAEAGDVQPDVEGGSESPAEEASAAAAAPASAEGTPASPGQEPAAATADAEEVEVARVPRRRSATRKTAAAPAAPRKAAAPRARSPKAAGTASPRAPRKTAKKTGNQ